MADDDDDHDCSSTSSICPCFAPGSPLTQGCPWSGLLYFGEPLFLYNNCMPNRYQLAFLASLSISFTSLVLLSRYINSALIAAGYDISQLILIGLPHHNPPTMPSIDPQQLLQLLKNLQLDDFRAVQIPILGTFDLVQLATSPAFIISALIIVSTAFYSNVLHTG